MCFIFNVQRQRYCTIYFNINIAIQVFYRTVSSCESTVPCDGQMMISPRIHTLLVFYPPSLTIPS